MSDTKEEEHATTEEPTFDVYMRFNGDEERDYCFQVHLNTKFGDLMEIFKVLPLNLSPSIFYDRLPIGFQLSTNPGILTREGGLLFGDDADKKQYLKRMNNDDVISEHAWPGQLIIPLFSKKKYLQYSVIVGLIVWLYTDLPDYISPTPGHSLTTMAVKGVSSLLRKINQDQMADNLVESMLEPVPEVMQWVFFAFHIVKDLIIYFVLWVGGFNPYSFTKKPAPIDRDDLLRIGWTSAKKAPVFDFSKEYRQYKVKQVGGTLKAYKSGILDSIKDTTVILGAGEGFQTPLCAKLSKDKVESDKFYLSYEYLRLQEEAFQKRHSTLSDLEFARQYKHYRRFGPFDAPKEFASKAQERIKISTDQEKKEKEQKEKKRD